MPRPLSEDFLYYITLRKKVQWMSVYFFNWYIIGRSIITEAADSGVYFACGDSPRSRFPKENASAGSAPAVQKILT